jgi:NAD(P)-dependent dehydrogenase (short-subunit alcohol dehydrogenase family)
VTRVAAVTGGAGAIGGAIVAGLRAAGHEVVIFDLNGTPVVDLANRGAVQRWPPGGSNGARIRPNCPPPSDSIRLRWRRR